MCFRIRGTSSGMFEQGMWEQRGLAVLGSCVFVILWRGGRGAGVAVRQTFMFCSRQRLQHQTVRVISLYLFRFLPYDA